MTDEMFSEIQLEQIENLVAAKVTAMIEPLEAQMDAFVTAWSGPLDPISGERQEAKGAKHKIDETYKLVSNGGLRARWTAAQWAAMGVIGAATVSGSAAIVVAVVRDMPVP